MQEKTGRVNEIFHDFQKGGGTDLCGLDRFIENSLGHQLVLESRFLTHPAELKLKFLVFCLVVDLVDAAR